MKTKLNINTKEANICSYTEHLCLTVKLILG